MKWASFSLRDESVVNQFRLKTLMPDHLDAVRRRAVGRDVERLVFLTRVVEIPRRRNVVLGVRDDVQFVSRATVSTGCSMGRASSELKRELKYDSSTRR